ADLFRGNVRATTLKIILICSLTLSGWWAFLFWHPQHLRSLPELASWAEPEKRQLVTKVFFAVIGISMLGNFFASFLAKFLGYRRTILWMSLGLGGAIFWTY